MTKEKMDRAFPMQYADDSFQTGMDLRDYFAAKALAAMIGKDNKDGANCDASGVGNLTSFAYEYADAMLEARK